MDIDELEAGRELDALVAEKVMGWKFIPLPERNRYGLCGNCGRAFYDDYKNRQEERGICDGDACFFSEEISAAWQVVEKLVETYYVDIGVDNGGAQVQLDRLDNEWELNIESTTADTTPLAICRAALKALA